MIVEQRACERVIAHRVGVSELLVDRMGPGMDEEQERAAEDQRQGDDERRGPCDMVFTHDCSPLLACGSRGFERRASGID